MLASTLFTSLAISMQCFNCSGYDKEPYEDPACKTVVNCNDAEDSCWIHVIRYLNNGMNIKYRSIDHE